MKKRLTEEQAQFLDDLVRRYSDTLTKYARRFFNSQQHMDPIADEAVQETWLKAVEEVEKLMNHPNPIGWLHTSLRYSLLNIQRDPRWKYETVQDAVNETPNSKLYAVLDAFDQLDRYPRLPEVLSAAEKILTPDERDTLYDHFLNGWTTKETAASECVTDDTVRGRISRIREKIKKYFKFLCYFMLILFYK